MKPNLALPANYLGKPNHLMIFADAESSAGKRQALSGLRSIGFIGYNNQQEVVFKKEFCATALAGRDDTDQVNRYWSTHAEEWAAINSKQQDRQKVCAEIRAMLLELTDLGWDWKLYLRPKSFDFRVLTELFQTLGIEILSKKAKFLNSQMSPDQILDQACCAYDLDGPKPGYYDERNDMESPFGFGGISRVVCMGNFINGAAKMLGLDSVDFRLLLSKIGRELTHNGLQDAVDQAAVWFRACKLINDFSRYQEPRQRRALLEFLLPFDQWVGREEQELKMDRNEAIGSMKLSQKDIFWQAFNNEASEDEYAWELCSTMYEGGKPILRQVLRRVHIPSVDHFLCWYTEEEHVKRFGKREGIEIVSVFQESEQTNILIIK